jgi:hypothetical protein
VTEYEYEEREDGVYKRPKVSASTPVPVEPRQGARGSGELYRKTVHQSVGLFKRTKYERE